MGEFRIAEVTVTFRLPYGNDMDEDAIAWRVRRISEDAALIATFYGVEADQLREHEDLHATATVKWLE